MFKNISFAFVASFLVLTMGMTSAHAFQQTQAKTLLYQYETVVKPGSQDYQKRTLTQINSRASINDKGTIAFKGSTGTGTSQRDNVFVSLLNNFYSNPLLYTDPLFELTNTSSSFPFPDKPNTQLFGVPQINNQNIVQVSRIMRLSYSYFEEDENPNSIWFTYLEKYNALQNNFPTELVAFGDQGQGPGFQNIDLRWIQPGYAKACGPFFNNFCFLRFISDWMWAGVPGGEPNIRYHSLSNNGLSAFPAFKNSSTWYLATPNQSGSYHIGDAYNEIMSIDNSISPVSIADNGDIVAKISLAPSSPIKLFDSYFNLKWESSGFISTGPHPNISDDGAILAFIGNEGTGNSLYASIDIGNGNRLTRRIVGEPNVTPPAPELGFNDDVANPKPIYFKQLDFHNSYVIHYELGDIGLKDDSFIIAFLATPSEKSPATFFTPGIKFSHQIGLWTVKVDIVEKINIVENEEIRSLEFKVNRPLPVLQVGDTIPDNTEFGVVTGIVFNDPIAKIDELQPPTDLILSQVTKDKLKGSSHRLAFGVKNAAGQEAIVMATHQNACLLAVRRMPQGWDVDRNNVPWRNNRLDCSTTIINNKYYAPPQSTYNTIGKSGCALTTMAMQLNYGAEKYNKVSVNPKELNDFILRLNKNKLEVNDTVGGYDGDNDLCCSVGSHDTGDSCQNNAAQERNLQGFSNANIVRTRIVNLFNNYYLGSNGQSPSKALEWVETTKFGKTPDAEIYLYNTLCEVDAPIHARVKFHPTGAQFGHSVLVSGIVNGKFLIADPAFAYNAGLAEKLSDYGDYRTWGHAEDPQDISYLVFVAGPDAELIVRDSQNRETGCKMGTEIVEIPESGASIDVIQSEDDPNEVTPPQCQVQIRHPGTSTFELTVRGLSDNPFDALIGGADTDGTTNNISRTIEGLKGKNLDITFRVSFVPQGTSSVVLISAPVPSVVSLSEQEAASVLQVVEMSVGTVTMQSSNTVPAGKIISQIPIAGTIVAPATKVDLVVSSGAGSPLTVPDVVGQNQANAEAAIVAAGLTVGTLTPQSSPTVPVGHVIGQNPAPNAPVAAGTAVDLVVSSGAAALNVPNVTGQSLANAEAAIVNAGLAMGVVTLQASNTVPDGNVISQNPAPNSQLAAGGKVDLVVSTGVALIAVPDVVGQTQTHATNALTNAGLVVGSITMQSSNTVAAGNVISQSPVANAQIAPGSSVNLVVSSGAAPPVQGDLDNDGDVDQNDVNLLLKDRNKPVAQSACGTPCDLDGDGKITALDARKLVLLCTRPNCATQ